MTKPRAKFSLGPEHPGVPTPQRYVAIFAVSCGAAAVVVDATAPVVALPNIAHVLRIDEASTTLVVAVYQMVLVTTILPFAAVAERLGARKLYCLGQAVFALASILCLAVTTFPEILALRVLQALGAGAALSSAGALMRAIYPSRQLGRGMGVQGTVVSLAMAFAPSFGGFVMTVAPWPWVFACAAPLSVITLLAARALPHLEGRAGKFDWLGAGICAVMLGLLMGSLQVVAHAERPQLAAALGIAGVVIAFLFVRNQREQERPILPVDLLAEPVLGLSALAALLAFTASMILMLSLPFRLESGYGMSAALIGLTMMAYPLLSMVLAPIAGVLSDKFRPDLLVALGLSIAASGLFLLGTLPEHIGTPWTVAWRMAIMGMGFGLFMTPNARVLIGSIPMHRTASGSSIISLTRLTGQTLDSAVAAVLLGLQFGNTGLPALAAGGMALLAAVLSVARSRVPARSDELARPLPGQDHRALPGTAREQGADHWREGDVDAQAASPHLSHHLTK